MEFLINRLLILSIFISIALIPLSCGSRKSITNIKNNAEIIKDEVKSKGEAKKVEEKKEVEKKVDKVKKEDESKTVVVVELFNDEGVIKSRTKEININKKTDSQLNILETNKTVYINTDSVFNNTITKTIRITSTVKDKGVTTNRNGLYWYLGICTVIGLVLWLKPWIK